MHVVNLTPPGVEPHDLELDSRRIDQLDRASVILELGKGFQPAVEKAAARRGSKTVRVLTARLDGQGPTVKVGVRPEKIKLEVDQGDPPSGWNCVSGTLRVSTFVGVSHQFTVDGPADTTLTVYAQNLGGDPVPQPGQRVRLVWRPEHTFVVKPSAPLADWEEEQ